MDKSASQMYIAHFCNPKTKLKAQEWTILCFIWKKEQNCISGLIQNDFPQPLLSAIGKGPFHLPKF